MAWVRIEDTVPHHPKHLKAGSAACWLWVCCIGYAQRQLTDGFVPTQALDQIGIKRDVDRLMKTLCDVGLMDRVEGGYQIHDYLHFNETKESVINRRQQRHLDKVKAGQAGASKRWQTNSRPIAAGNGRLIAPSHPIPSHPIHQATPDSEVANLERAGSFMERYVSLYAKHRHGARYHVREARDFPQVLELVRSWSDDAHLDKLVTILLTSDDDWISRTDRGIGIFIAKVSWCDDRLREWEAKQEKPA